MADIPIGYCQCGCGTRTKIADRNSKRDGWVKGFPIRYLPNHHKRSSPVEYVVDNETNCWVWQRFIRHDGYGEAHIRGERGNRPAHRVVYERHKGKIPEGLDLDHLCRNRKCVNPDHLEPVTRRVNLSRGEGGFNNFASHYEKMQNDPVYNSLETQKRIKGRNERGQITDGEEN